MRSSIVRSVHILGCVVFQSAAAAEGRRDCKLDQELARETDRPRLRGGWASLPLPHPCSPKPIWKFCSLRPSLFRSDGSNRISLSSQDGNTVQCCQPGIFNAFLENEFFSTVRGSFSFVHKKAIKLGVIPHFWCLGNFFRLPYVVKSSFGAFYHWRRGIFYSGVDNPGNTTSSLRNSFSTEEERSFSHSPRNICPEVFFWNAYILLVTLRSCGYFSSRGSRQVVPTPQKIPWLLLFFWNANSADCSAVDGGAWHISACTRKEKREPIFHRLKIHPLYPSFDR